ncbi:hypothetical protein I3760_02G183100 [Carya illinoinensis]|nr:hypothetical protein I3760_02G183100 [Carya illinoinensis]KAG2723741.1 hypothetical protein I3760_02G183100 [Carya illinoinensis]
MGKEGKRISDFSRNSVVVFGSGREKRSRRRRHLRVWMKEDLCIVVFGSGSTGRSGRLRVGRR